ncbi:MAG: SGNH/GDSL hydrolase family protein [Candidatus Binatia bacterium]|nr:SGNH/GDSL hydrolase family protein [Candidatus Binatia bacterium]
MAVAQQGNNRTWLTRAGLLLLGMALGLGAAEAVLQLGAHLQANSRRPIHAPLMHTRRVRILALGDSNTFGLWIEREAAYPKLTETLWNERAGQSRIEVFNLGYPGTNSSQVLAAFDHYMAAFKPDFVTLMIGANDAWTLPVTSTATGEHAISRHLQRWLWAHSRLYRLLYMLWRARENSRLEVTMVSDPANVASGSGVARFGEHEFELGHKMAPAGVPDWMKRVEANLRAIIAAARWWNIPLILMTYPSGSFIYGAANDVVRKVARSTGTPLVDVTDDFAQTCPEWSCDELFPDQHPTEKGHRRVAEALVAFFRQSLGDTH